MKLKLVELSPEACAIIDSAVRESASRMADLIAANAVNEDSQDQFGETFQLGRQLATAETLIAALDKADAIYFGFRV